MSLVIILLQGDDFMAINNVLKKRLQIVTEKVAFHDDDLSSYRINKADYDKTLIGYVSEKIIPENPKDAYDYKWRIQTNGTAYDIKPSACNITSVGQRVRLYIPNHDYYNKYAEVLTGDENTHPTKVVYSDGKSTEITDSGTDKHTVTNDTITETWQNVDGTSYQTQYTIVVKDKGTIDENVEKMIFPDGSEMKLEGFQTFFGGEV